MKIAIALLVGVLLIWAVAQAANAQISQLPNGAKYIANKIIVVNENGAPSYLIGQSRSAIAVTGVASVDELCRQIGVLDVAPFYPGILRNPILKEEISRFYIFTLANGVDAFSVLSRFEADPNIKIAELYSVPELCYTPNDPRYPDQWYLPFTHADSAWNTVRGDTTRHSIIGIVDSGVHWDHPDLTGNIWINAAEDINHNGIFDSGDHNGIDDDNNGFIDDVVGWDFGDSDDDPVDDVAPHGTAVAGCASEVTDNGLRGAAIGFSARIMCLKMSSNGYQGIVYAADNGAKIINCSWSLLTFSQAEQDIINTVWQTGALVIASAGGNGNTTPVYPAAYDHVMAVAATDQSDQRASFSGYGSWVDICAPGVNIWTTFGSSDFVEYSGTSFSTGIVSGLAALIHALLPTLINDEIEQLIEDSADSIPNNNGLLGAGRINCVAWIPTVNCPYIPGDINGNGSVNGIDIVFAVNYFMGRGGPPPVNCYPYCPTTPDPFYAAGDVNGNCAFNGIDITFFVRFVQGQPPGLLYCPDCPPAGLQR